MAAALVAAAVAGTVEALPGSIGSRATTHAPAIRGVAWNTTAECDMATVTALAGRHPDVRQFVVLSTSRFGATYGDASVAARLSNGDWVCQAGTSAARFGRTGTRPLFDRRSGDGTTPAGVFALGEVTAWDGRPVNVFGNRPDPGVRSNVHYRDVRAEDCWGATPNHPDYNHLVAKPGCSGPDDEWLPRFGDVYSHAAVIGANLDPISGDEPGEAPYAAAIFLHRHSYGSTGATRPTSGCVSLAADDLVEAITLLDPALEPHFAIGPVDYLRSTA
jgi:L,D-peptidoglycan transpeptidase YkuD (ErfK/YbiS/YcfS/YnhG family)